MTLEEMVRIYKKCSYLGTYQVGSKCNKCELKIVAISDLREGEMTLCDILYEIEYIGKRYIGEKG